MSPLGEWMLFSPYFVDLHDLPKFTETDLNLPGSGVHTWNALFFISLKSCFRYYKTESTSFAGGPHPSSCSWPQQTLTLLRWYLRPHLSASSNTTYSTLCSFKFISTATCTNRPGVAMILEGGTQARSPHGEGHWPYRKGPQSIPDLKTHMSGFSCRAANWSSILRRRRKVSSTAQVSQPLFPSPNQMCTCPRTPTPGMELRS
jgi:hypothetical protein